MSTLNLKPAHKAVKAYFDEIQAVAHLDFYLSFPSCTWERRFPPKLCLGTSNRAFRHA